MKEIVDLYVCSKPLQYLNVINIPKVTGSATKRILIVKDSFINADRFVENLRQVDKTWYEISLVNKFTSLCKLLKKYNVNFLFIDNDFMYEVTICFYLKRIKKVYAYEEGVGSYCSKIELESAYKKNHSIFGNLLSKLLRINLHFGGSYICSGIFLYLPNFYNFKFNSSKALSFKNSFLDNLSIHKQILDSVFDKIPDSLNFTEKKILLYVTDWNIDKEIVTKMHQEAQNFDLCLIKPHPHITFDTLAEYNKLNWLIFLQTNIPSEILILNLLKNKNTVTIWHCCSTSVIYFNKTVECSNFKYLPVYNQIENYINTKQN